MAQPEVLERARDIERLIGPPRVYTPEHVVYKGERAWLDIVVGNTPFKLPLVNVATPEEPIAIAWLNTDVKVNPRLARAAAGEMSLHIASRAPRVVVMPASSKSEWYIREAVQGASTLLQTDITLIRLPGGRDRAKVQQEIGEGSVLSYKPVTLKAGELKYIGISDTDFARIDELCPNGEGLVFADDVLTTGATHDEMTKLLQLPQTSFYHSVFLAREGFFDSNYPPQLGSRMHAVFYLPEMPWPVQDVGALFKLGEAPVTG